MADATDDAPDALQDELADIEFSGRKLAPRTAMLVGLIGAVWSLFQLWIASPMPFWFGFGIIVGVPARGIHLAFALLLCFLMYPAAKSLDRGRIPIYDFVLAALGVYACLYLYFAYEGLAERMGTLLAFDLSLVGWSFSFPFEAIVGGIGMLLLLDATRRSIGLPLVVIAGVFLIYSIFGQIMP